MTKSLFSKFFSALLIVTLALGAMPATPAKAASIVVNTLTDEDTNVGTLCSLREAIIAANTDAAYNDCTAGSGADTITLTSGSTYVLTLVGAGQGDLDVSSNITINTTAAGVAIIDPDTATFNERVFDVNATGNLTLDTIRITTAVTGNDGAAVRSAGTLTIQDNSEFISNQSNAGGGGSNGGAISITGGTASISNSTFSGNTATGDGGAIFVSGGTLTVTNSTFTNTTAANSADSGGAIYHNAATLLTITNSTFTGNTATAGDGGAINLNSSAAGSSAAISGSTFTSNTSTDDGGAIRNDSQPFTITTSTFSGNSISSSTNNSALGGAIRNEANADGTTITLSTFVNNSVTHTTTNDDDAFGGAIHNEGTAFVLANVTFSGNSASFTGNANNNAQGGALWTNAGTTIHNVTFSGNSVSESGTGVATSGGNIFRSAGTLTVANTIVTGGSPDNCSGTITNGGNNIDSGASCGWGALLGSVSSTDPLLGALTGSPQYFPLNTGSPALNTGSNAICATATSTNNQSQNGVTRPAGVNCEIGSYEAPTTTTLTLQKTVVNDNGGTALDTDWTLSANGPTPISGVEGNAAVTNAVVTPGDYTLSESVISGYSNSGIWSCTGATGPNNDDDVASILAGDNVTCVITNDDIAPVLTLLKSVTNNNGGTALDTAWTLNAAGPTNISGVEGAAGVTNAAVNAGNYTLSETGGPSGYTQTGLSCTGAADTDPSNGLALALGETVTCTFANDDVSPVLTLLKSVTNDNGGTAADTDWTLNASGPTNISGVEGAAGVTNAAVNAGNYTLTESGGPSGYTQTGLSCTGAADTDPSDGLAIALGETVTCTFANNDDAATLTLLKDVTNDNGGTASDTDWTLNAAGPTNISGVEGAAGVTNAPVSAGNYTLTESGGPSEYTQTGLSCTGAADTDPSDGLTIALGETVTCTFANNDVAPVLTLLKDITNDNGGTALDSAFTLSATGPDTISGIEGAAAVTNAVVDAGSYTLSESGASNYTNTAITCTGTDTDGSDGLDLNPGETVTCTFANNDNASTLTLQKTTVNDNGGTAADTDWTLNAAGPTNLSGVDGNAAVTNAPVTPGSYTLTESGGPSGYTQTGLSCTGAADTDPSDGLTIALGEAVTCTFTNDDVAPTLTLLKDITNDNGGASVDADWTLSATGPTNISGVEGNASITNATVDAGSYTLGESGVPGYTNTAITCTGNDTDGSDGLDLDPGETVTCTFFNNDDAATLTLVKNVTNDNIGTALDTDWTLSAAGPTNISGVEGDASITNASVSAGNYTLSESGPSGYTNTAITCNGTDTDGSDGLTLDLGEDVTCTFENDDDVPVLLVPNVDSNPDTGDGSVTENEVIPSTPGITQLIVEFNWDVNNPGGDAGADDVTNPANYLLLRSATGTFNTLGCGPVVAPDVNIPVTSVTYSNGGGSGPFIATLNLSAPLTTDGFYRLYVCGTTSIVLAADTTVALAGDGSTAGTDFPRNFQITTQSTPPGPGGEDDNTPLTVAALPATGFAPNRVTILPEQPEELAYASLGDLWVEIPSLGIKTSIVGVPQTKSGEWDVTWLGNNVGWLNGTAFPSWEGNSVLTAHVTNASGLNGPFTDLKKLKYGEQIIVHAFGQKYIFEVRNSRLTRPFSTSFAFEHLEDQSYLTLITCQVYLPNSDTYLFRRVVRAVLVSVEDE